MHRNNETKTYCTSALSQTTTPYMSLSAHKRALSCRSNSREIKPNNNNGQNSTIYNYSFTISGSSACHVCLHFSIRMLYMHRHTLSYDAPINIQTKTGKLKTSFGRCFGFCFRQKSSTYANCEYLCVLLLIYDVPTMKIHNNSLLLLVSIMFN